MSTTAHPDNLHPPVGDDLEYDAEFLLMEQAAKGKPEQQFGATVIAAQEPDWAEVDRLAGRLLARTQDLRVIARQTRAWTELRGLHGYADGVALALQVLESNWDEVHPRLRTDDDHDPLPRMNALLELGEPQGMGRSVRNAALVADARGTLSVRDAEAIMNGGAGQTPPYPGGRTQLTTQLRAAAAEEGAAVHAAQRAWRMLTRVQDVVASRIGHEWVPDYSALERTFATLAAAAELQPDGGATPMASATPAVAADPAIVHQHTLPATTPGTDPALSDAAIRSREDAAVMLAMVARYFEQHEPSHPAPFLLRRVEQLVAMDFYELLQNLAPQGVAEFEHWLPRQPQGQG